MIQHNMVNTIFLKIFSKTLFILPVHFPATDLIMYSLFSTCGILT